tara:strand:- start:280 stop:1077 length:798 start_codon:yes stop_codon:yes gene_type:complete
MTFYPNHSSGKSSEELRRLNEWYFWGLQNVQSSRGNPNAYMKFIGATRTGKTTTAFGYLTSLKNQSATWIRRLNAGGGGKRWEHNQMNDDIFALEKMLKAWEAKRAVEIPIEIEAKRLSDIEDRRLAVIEKERLVKVEKQRLIDIENKRLIQLSNNALLLEEVRSNPNVQVSDEKLLQLLNQEKIQNVTFNEQVNSGDFNETPITDINLNNGCSECTEPEHQMPDGSLMKDSEMEKKPLNNNMKFAGIAAAGVIGLLLYSKGGLK